MFDAAPHAQPAPLPQSVEFARALDVMGLSTQRLDIGAGQGSALLQSRMVPGLGIFGLISRGPVLHDLADPDALRAALTGLGYPLFINSEAGAAEMLSRAGLMRVMSPATVAMMDLTGGFDALRARMHGKWRNRLRRAETGALRVRVLRLPDARTDWILRAEMAQRRTRGYRGLPPELAAAYGQANPGAAQLFEALLEGVPVAGMVVLRHGAAATYFLGATTEAGRAAHAHTLLLARVAEHLAAGGAALFDLGTLDTENAPGLARFKLGSGARAEVLDGTWFFSPWLAGLLRPKPLWRRHGSP